MDNPLKNIAGRTRDLFKIRFLRNVFLVAVTGALAMPLIIQFIIYPQFSSYLVSIIEDDAKRIAHHLALELDTRTETLSYDSIPASLKVEAQQVLDTLGLSKFKIFSRSGETLYSTDSEDTGVLNENPYFRDSVSKGSIYTLVVHKEQVTAEGVISTTDVVETYVPLFNEAGGFVGAFEIYFEITERLADLRLLMFWSALGVILAVVIIMVALYQALIRAADITVKRQREQVKLQLAADVMANAEEGILVTDSEGNIESVNRAFTELTGYSEAEVLGRNPRFLNSGRHDSSFFKNIWKTIEAKGMWQGEIWNRRKNGEIYPEWLTINAIKDAQGEVANYMGIFLDITHFKKREDQLEMLAYRDALTGLPNRSLVKDRLEQNMAVARRLQVMSAVLYLDLDGFKAVNDRHGHNLGDLLLQEVTRRFSKCIREEDTLGRLGGDEFIICVRKVAQFDELTLVARRLINSLERHHLIIDGHRCPVSVSIGISIYPEHGDDVESLIRCADIAMYLVKMSGKRGYRLYHPSMEETPERLVSEAEA